MLSKAAAARTSTMLTFDTPNMRSLCPPQACSQLASLIRSGRSYVHSGSSRSSAAHPIRDSWNRATLG